MPQKEPTTPVLLLAKRQSVAGYRKAYFDSEEAAIKKAGFELLELDTGMFGINDTADYQLQGKTVFCRHYADQDSYFIPYIEKRGGKLAVPEYPNAQNWYKILPLDFVAHEYFGGRRMAHYRLAKYGYLEEPGQYEALKTLVKGIFTWYSVDGKVFAKSETKNSFNAAVYTQEELLDTLQFLLGVGCHKTPSELIVSQPMPVGQLESEYKLDEYRCLIVGNKVSTVSLYTDKKKLRDYTQVIDFAAKFAKTFAGHLPNSYDLDVSRLTTGKLAVVELNDISACGFFADHDLNKLFKDIYSLALKA